MSLHYFKSHDEDDKNCFWDDFGSLHCDHDHDHDHEHDEENDEENHEDVKKLPSYSQFVRKQSHVE